MKTTARKIQVGTQPKDPREELLDSILGKGWREWKASDHPPKKALALFVLECLVPPVLDVVVKHLERCEKCFTFTIRLKTLIESKD